jgi:hypothetical protein
VTVPAVLVVASAAIVLALGTLHFIYTFWSSKLRPREASLEAQLKAVSPVISREMTMWQAWISFNATHSFGAILFGAVYGYLALFESRFLFDSVFLCGLGLLVLVGYVVIGRLYWFSAPFRGVVIATVCYGAGLVLAWAQE